MFHIAQLEVSNKENCSINCNVGKHLAYITIFPDIKYPNEIPDNIYSHLCCPAPGGMSITLVSSNKSSQTNHHWLSYIMY